MLLAAAALVPVTVWTTTASASAASGSLTVTTYDRQGVPVAAPLTFVNVSTNAEYTGTGGRSRSLPNGTYAVLTNISTSSNGSDTLGARVLKVSGSTATTIDARWGKPLTLSLDPASDGEQELQAHICAANSTRSVSSYNRPGSIYVIPNPSERLQSAFSSTWGIWTGEQWVATVSGATIPATLTRTVKRSSMANLTAWVKRGPAGAPESHLSLDAESDSCRGNISATLQQAQAPFTVKTHVTPGKWSVRADTYGVENGEYAHIGSQWATRSFTGGKAYTQTFFRSAWGPGGSRPEVFQGRVVFNTSGMFTDPGFAWGTDLYGFEASQKSTVTLSRGGTVLYTQSRTDWGSLDTAIFDKKITKKGWYLLKVAAQRYRPGVQHPADLMSNKSGVWFSFYANPATDKVVPVPLPRLTPQGLDMSNGAKLNSTTTVDIKLQGKANVKTVSATVSLDNGTTWTSVPVTKSGSLWKATVRNSKAGMIGLRSRVETTEGYKGEVTIYRAYRVR